MSSPNEGMISNIKQKLNIVNRALLNPEKFKSTPHQDISEIYEFVMPEDSFSPSEVTVIADHLGQLR